MALLGSSVDPRLFIQDYSGFVDASKTQAQTMAGIGQTIGDIGKMYAERKKEQADQEKDIKIADNIAAAVEKSMPELVPNIGEIRGRIADKNIPLSERHADAKSILAALQSGVQVEQLKAQRAETEARKQAAVYSYNADINRARLESEAKKAPVFKLEKVKVAMPDGSAFEAELPYDEKRGMFYDPSAKKYIKDVQAWALGEPAYDEQVSNETSQFTAPTTYYGFGKDVNGPDEIQDKWTNQGYTSTGKNLTEGVAAVNTQKYPLGTIFRDSDSGEVLIAADSHGNKDPNVIDVYRSPSNYVKKKENKSYEVIGQIPREQIPKTPSGIASLIEQYSGNQSSNLQGQASSIDNAISMGGDLSQQAMGSPAQQALVAQMIQEGQGLGSAQNAADRASGTEPSLSQQQAQVPQQPQQYKLRAGFVPVEPKNPTVESVTGDAAAALKLDPRGTYAITKIGNRVTKIDVTTAPPTAEQTAKAQKSQEEIQKATRAKEIALKTIDEFIDPKTGKATQKLDDAVGYGEAFATGVAEYAPILGTQSEESRSNQQRLSRLVESGVLDAASLLKPVSNTDLELLIRNRPMITSPTKVWEEYFADLKRILGNPNNYIDSPSAGGTQSESTQPQPAMSPSDRLRALREKKQ